MRLSAAPGLKGGAAAAAGELQAFGGGRQWVDHDVLA
jgi:hypothetical protein